MYKPCYYNQPYTIQEFNTYKLLLLLIFPYLYNSSVSTLLVGHICYKLVLKKENVSHTFINLVENIQEYNMEKI